MCRSARQSAGEKSPPHSDLDSAMATTESQLQILHSQLPTGDCGQQMIYCPVGFVHINSPALTVCPERVESERKGKEGKQLPSFDSYAN